MNLQNKLTGLKAGPRRACFFGPKSHFGELIEQALVGAGYELGVPGAPCAFDLVIDNASRSASELRAVVSSLNEPVGQYVLISSHHVYPSSVTLRPWIEEDADKSFDLSVVLPPLTMAARATERELRLLAGGDFPITMLRPSLIEGDESCVDATHWFADRILDGGVVVLPEGDLPSYRHVSQADLVAAIMTVAGCKDAYGRVLNVTNQATLSYWGHAAMVRDGLGLPLQIGYVPSWRWRAAGLTLPLGELASSSFIESSPLLHKLGWRAQDSYELIRNRATQRAKQSRPNCGALFARERQVMTEAGMEALFQPTRSQDSPQQQAMQQWVLRGWAGQPSSLALERLPLAAQFPAPVVKVRALTLLAAEERFLRGEYPQQGHRAIGHNAILEILSPGPHALTAGAMAVPMSVLPCGEPECPFCRGGLHAVLGIGCDGYGWGVCSTPPSHMLTVPSTLGMTALLLDPLASLIAGISDRLANDSAPVWIAGRTFEAALVAWLAQDAGRPVLHVDRRDWTHPEFPVRAIEPLLAQRRSGAIVAPTLAVDFTGSADVSWPLGQALAEGGHLFVRRRPPGIPQGIHWHELPAAAPNRASLEDAVIRLQRWAQFRNVGQRVGPAVPLEQFWDALLPAPFSLPYLEGTT